MTQIIYDAFDYAIEHSGDVIVPQVVTVQGLVGNGGMEQLLTADLSEEKGGDFRSLFDGLAQLGFGDLHSMFQRLLEDVSTVGCPDSVDVRVKYLRGADDDCLRLLSDIEEVIWDRSRDIDEALVGYIKESGRYSGLFEQ